MSKKLLIVKAIVFIGLILQACNYSNQEKKKDAPNITQQPASAKSSQLPAAADSQRIKQKNNRTATSRNGIAVNNKTNAAGLQNSVAASSLLAKNEGIKRSNERQESDEELREPPEERKIGKSPEKREEEEAEEERYDGILAAQKQEYEMTHDPATNTIPKERLLPMLARRRTLIAEGKQRIRRAEQTIAVKSAVLARTGTTTAIDATSWVERGSNADRPGPYGNERDSIACTSGRIAALWTDLDPSKPNQIFIGGIDGGLWSCPDITANPATWTFLDNFSNIGISSICQDPTNTNIMYFGTGEKTRNDDAVRGGGVWKSADHGQTWNLLPGSTGLWNVSKILCDKNGYIYVGTIGNGTGLQRSTDGGTTWTDITPNVGGINTKYVSDMVYDPVRDRMHVYMGYSRTAGSSIGYVYGTPSAVASSSWSIPASPVGNIKIGVVANGNNMPLMVELAVSGTAVWALSGNSGNIQIYQSVDAGNTWVLRSTLTGSQYGIANNWYSLGVDCDPASAANLIFGNLNVFKSTDSGKTFTQKSEWVKDANPGAPPQYVHADVHNVKYGLNGRVIVCSDGGVFLSTNAGNNWADRNAGLRIKQFYSVAINPSVQNYFLAGAQDNGVHQFTKPGLDSSIEVSGGDGAIVMIDQQNPNYQIGTYTYNNYKVSSDGGSTWRTTTFGDGSGSYGSFINPYDYDSKTKKLYACYLPGRYLRWNNLVNPSDTATISIASSAIGNDILTAVTVSSNLANTVYMAGASNVIKVIDANTSTPTFNTITPPGAIGSYLSCIAIGPSATDQDIIVTSSSYGTKKVFISANGGTTWTDITGNLPDMPVRWALFYPGSNTQAYIATEAGVWYTTAINGSATNWQPSVGLPAVRTDMIKYCATNNIIAAATHGRGLWTAKISTTPKIAYYNAQLTQSKSAGTTVSNCRTYQDYSGTLQISDPPNGAATVTIAAQPGGTARQGVDYDFTTNGSFTSPSNTATFASGAYPNKIPIAIRVYNNHDKNAAVNQPQTANLSLSVSGSTDAAASASNNTLTLNLTDVFDTVTTVKSNQMLWSEDWESWPATSSQWTFNPDLDAHTPNAIGFIPNTACYTINNFTAQLLSNDANGNSAAHCLNYTPGTFNTIFYRPVKAGSNFYSNMSVAFQYKIYAGTGVANALVCSTDNGATWNVLASYTGHNYTSISTANVIIPDSLNYKDFLLGWRSTGSSAATDHTALFSIDSIVFRGNIKPAIDSVVEGSLPNYQQSSQSIDYVSSRNFKIANLSNLSQDLGCTTASIDSAGTTWRPFLNGLRSQKVISITPTTNGSTASYTVGLYFTANELGGINPSTLKIAKSDATTLAAANASNTTLLTTTVAPYLTGYLLTANATGFSKFFLTNASVTLPVTLNSFNGYLDNQGHSALRWTAGVENNLSRYEVERSYDNVQFTSIGSVLAAGASSYSFTDPVLALPSNYYRLKMVDVTDKFTYSPIVLITNNAAIGFVKLLGNPVTSQISLLINNKVNSDVNASLISMNGQIIKQWNLGRAEGKVILPLNNTAIASGIYILTITAGNQKVDLKIMKK